MLILRWKSLSASGVARAMGLAIWAIAPAGGLAACVQPRSEAQELLVFAAASLGNALGEIEEIYEERSQTDVLVSYGASQMLAQQIASGAPADVFISAGEFPVEFLTRREMLDSAVSELLTTNLVVAIRTAGGPQVTSMEQLAGPGVGADCSGRPGGRSCRPLREGVPGEPGDLGTTSRRSWCSDRTCGLPWPTWSPATRTWASSTARTRGQRQR